MSGTLVGMNQINFTWQDNSTNETDFVVQMLADDGITWVSIADVAANTTSYSLTNVASGKSYSFRVLAHNDAGYSDPSLSTNVTTPLTDVFSVATVSTTKKTRSSVSGSTASAPTQTAVS